MASDSKYEHDLFGRRFRASSKLAGSDFKIFAFGLGLWNGQAVLA